MIISSPEKPCMKPDKWLKEDSRNFNKESQVVFDSWIISVMLILKINYMNFNFLALYIINKAFRHISYLIPLRRVSHSAEADLQGILR